MPATIGTYVRERRQHLGLTQEQLVERIGDTYSQSDISGLERGEVDLPRIGTLVKLASALEVPVGNLLIASGWFDDGYVISMATLVEAGEQDTLVSVLSAIEAELDTILGLEDASKDRSDRLRAMVRDLRATSGLSVTMAEQGQHG